MRNGEARLLVGLLVVSFVAGALARLNPFHLLNPDGEDYVLRARAIVAGRGYRDIDEPAEPLHALRPPGVSLLLAPAALLRPYDIAAAKLTLAAAGGLLIVLTHALAARGSPGRASIAVTALVATSPYLLLFGTEIAGEVPYAAMTLALLGLVERGYGPRRLRTVALFALLLASLPFVRATGVTFVVAVLLWAISNRSRWCWLPAVAAAGVSFTCWAIRNARAAMPTYEGHLLVDLTTVGPRGAFVSFAAGVAYYFEAVAGTLLPGALPGRPDFWRVMLDDTSLLPGPRAAYAAAAAGLGLLAMAGMARRWDRSGALALSYLVVAVAALALYPYRYERYAWPLVPVLLAYVPAGLEALAGTLAARLDPQRARAALTARWSLAIAAGGLISWQLVQCGRMVAANLSWRSDPAGFHGRDAPPYYYCDFPAAGRWLREHAAPEARILTRQALGCSARRFQRVLRSEFIEPEALHAQIATFGATFLVVPGRDFPEYFRWDLLAADPSYRFESAYEAGGVVVLTIAPNPDGTAAIVDDAAEELARARAFRAKRPARVDFELALARALAATGRDKEALERLESLEAKQVTDGVVAILKGSLELRLGRYEAAMKSFRRAAFETGIGGDATVAFRGLRQARQGLAAATGPKANPAGLLDRARALRADLRFEAALRLMERALESPQADPAAHRLRAEILERLGRTDEAVRELAPIAESDEAAARQLSMLRLERSSDAGIPEHPAALLALARYRVQGGLTGRALAILEQASKRYPDVPELVLERGQLEAFHGLLEAAELSFLSLEVPDGTYATAARNARHELAARRIRPRF